MTTEPYMRERIEPIISQHYLVTAQLSLASYHYLVITTQLSLPSYHYQLSQPCYHYLVSTTQLSLPSFHYLVITTQLSLLVITTLLSLPSQHYLVRNLVSTNQSLLHSQQYLFSTTKQPNLSFSPSMWWQLQQHGGRVCFY